MPAKAPSTDPLQVATVMRRLMLAKPAFTPPLRGSVIYDYNSRLYRIAIGVTGVMREVGYPPEQMHLHPAGWYWDFAVECFVLSLRDPHALAKIRALPNLPRFVPVRGVSSDLILDTRITNQESKN